MERMERGKTMEKKECQNTSNVSLQNQTKLERRKLLNKNFQKPHIPFNLQNVETKCLVYPIKYKRASFFLPLQLYSLLPYLYC